jgi:FMN phosphatase YigB (HAD superfamily)
LKPRPSIFQAALDKVNVAAADAVMVGDNVRQDIEGALAVGMRAVLLHRDDAPHPQAEKLDAAGVLVIRSLRELPSVIGLFGDQRS